MKIIPFVTLLTTLLASFPALAHSGLSKPSFLTDPLRAEKTVAKTPLSGMLKEQGATACVFPHDKKPFTLEDVAERALCHNPLTRESWATAKMQAAQLGISRSAYLPTIAGSAPLAWQKSHLKSTDTTSHSQTFDTTLSLNYLLFSFSREANVETFRQRLKAANWAQDDTLQTVLLQAITQYYQLFSAREAVESNKQAEKYSRENLKSATVRFEVGVATLADKLQAATAYSQATLNRVRSEGEERIALGNLANVMGLDAGTPLAIVPPTIQKPVALEEKNIKLLIDQAKTARPDLLEAEAQVKAARANVRAVKGSGLPSLSLVGTHTTIRSDNDTDGRNSTLGVTASFPLFNGFNTHYLTRTAKAELENQEAARDLISNQVALDVWNGYYNLITETESLKASADLLKSAVESEKVAQERYKAGVGSILELLNAESDLASARLQHIQSRYNWYIAKATLARAIGTLKLDARL